MSTNRLLLSGLDVLRAIWNRDVLEDGQSLEEIEMVNRTINCKRDVRKPLLALVCSTLIYYHCAYRNSSLLSLVADVFIVLLCSLAILGLLFRHMNIAVPVDPIEWQISQETANGLVACLANTIGAAESVLRVAATGYDKRLFFKVIVCLYALSVLGRLFSGVAVAYAGLCTFCLYMLLENSESISDSIYRFLRGKDFTSHQDATTI